MASLRIVLAVLALGLALAACGGPDDRDLRRAVVAGGCAGMPASKYQKLPDRVVLSVSAGACTAADTRGRVVLLNQADAIAVMTRAVWSTPTYGFDSLFVTVYRSADSRGAAPPHSVEIPRAQLVADLGQRDPALDAALPEGAFERQRSEFAWSVLPLLAAVIGLFVLVRLIRGMRSGHIALLWFFR